MDLTASTPASGPCALSAAALSLTEVPFPLAGPLLASGLMPNFSVDIAGYAMVCLQPLPVGRVEPQSLSDFAPWMDSSGCRSVFTERSFPSRVPVATFGCPGFLSRDPAACSGLHTTPVSTAGISLGFLWAWQRPQRFRSLERSTRTCLETSDFMSLGPAFALANRSLSLRLPRSFSAHSSKFSVELLGGFRLIHTLPVLRIGQHPQV